MFWHELVMLEVPTLSAMQAGDDDVLAHTGKADDAAAPALSALSLRGF